MTVLVLALTACDRANPPLSSGEVTVAFRGGSPDSAGFGDVSVYPLNRSALGRLMSATPSIEDWQRILHVHIDSTNAASGAQPLALLGTYEVAGDTLRFRPRFTPASGVTYAARFDAAALNARLGQAPSGSGQITVSWRHESAAGAPSTFVRAIYPSADVVPMNLLRMYVEFSAPMTGGKSYDFIKLYAEGDSLLEEPFFTAAGQVELWDPERTRLTILFDPGRIKRDLKPHEEAGLPLRSGKRYRLVIDSTWRDAQGRPLIASFVKEFRVGAQDRVLIRTSDWRVTSPRASSRDSVVVTFPEPLDRALLLRLVAVRDSSGALIDGDASVSDRETRWAFAPKQPWRRESYALHVDTELEDLAGNNLRKLFDVAPGDSAATGVDAPSVRVWFRPR